MWKVIREGCTNASREMYAAVVEVHKCRGVGDREERDEVGRSGHVGKTPCELQQNAERNVRV